MIAVDDVLEDLVQGVAYMEASQKSPARLKGEKRTHMQISIRVRRSVMQNEERALRVVPLKRKPVNMTTVPDNQNLSHLPPVQTIASKQPILIFHFLWVAP